VIVRGKVGLLGGTRSARPWFLGHGTVVDNVVPPRGHKLRIKERDRAVLFVDDGVEHVTGFSVKHDGRIGLRLDVNLVELLLPEANKRSQFTGR
jgi:hypothetical protein